MDVYSENRLLRERLKKTRQIIGGHSVFVIMRRWHEPEVYATVYRKGEAPDGTFIQLALDIEDLGKLLKAELESGKCVDEAVRAILEDVKYVSNEVIK